MLIRKTQAYGGQKCNVTKHWETLWWNCNCISR